MYAMRDSKKRWIYLVVLTMIIQLVSGVSLRAENVEKTCLIGGMEVAFSDIKLMEITEYDQQKETTVFGVDEQKEVRYSLKLIGCPSVDIDKELIIKLPKELGLIRNEVIPLQIIDTDGISIQVGTCEMTTNEQEIAVGIIKFLDKIKEYSGVEITFGIGVKSQVAVADGKSEKKDVVFEVDQMKKSMLIEFKGKDSTSTGGIRPPTIEKTHEKFDPKTEQIIWDITVIAGDKELENAIIKDTCNANYLYVEDVVGANYREANGPYDTVISIDVPTLSPREKRVFKVVTHVKDEVYAVNNKSVTIQNTASLQDKDGHRLTETIDPTDSEVINVEWISKRDSILEQQVNDGVVTKYILCYNYINKHYANLEGRTLKNYLPKGLKLVEDTIKINNRPLASVTSLGTLTYHNNEAGTIEYTDQTNQKKSFNYNSIVEFKFNDTLSPSDAHNMYEISYQVEVTDEIEAGAGEGSEYSKVASINMQPTEDGQEHCFYYYLNSGTKNIGEIQKSFTKYDQATHKISWTVSANRKNSSIGKLEIVDTLPEGLKLDKSTFKVGNTVITSVPTQIGESDMMVEGKCENGIITCSIYKADKSNFNQGYIITFDTDVEDKMFYASNSSKQVYKNRVYANYYTAYEGGIVNKGSETYAEAIVISCVTSKFAGDFNNKTKQMTWYIVVNQNGMPIENLKLIDQLDEKQTYAPYSIKVIKSGKYQNWEFNVPYIKTKLERAKASDIIDVGEPSITNNAQGQLLEWDLGNVNDTYTIEIKTDVDTTEPFKLNGEDPILKNAVNIASQSIYEDLVPVEAEKTVTNSFIKCVGKQIKKDEPIDWMILVNPNELKIDNIQISDVLSKDLRLELDDLKVYKASVDNDKIKSSTFDELDKSKGAEVTLDADQISYNKDKNELKLTLGDMTECYLITFKTKVISPKMVGEYSNKAVLTSNAEVTESVISNEVTVSTQFSNSWGTITTDVGTIKVIATDADHEDTKLQGAEFKLSNGRYTFTAETDENGEAIFKDLVIGRDYTLYESKAPEGYELDKNTYPITLDSTHKNGEQAVTNKKEPGSLTVVKVDAADNTPLPDAVFELSDDGDYKKSVTTNADGEAEFNGLEIGKTYALKETTAPTGYELDETVCLVEINNKVVKVIRTNKKKTGSIKVNKVDETDQSIKLAGATFELSDGTKTLEGTTDDKGELIFNNLELGKTYTLHEKTAPFGYVLGNENSYEIKLTSDKPEVEQKVTNKKETLPPTPPIDVIKGTLEIALVDKETSELIDGGEFTLTVGGKTYEGKTGKDGETGKLVFTNLTIGEDYILEETKAPAGYVKDTQAKTGTIQQDSKCEFKNEKETQIDPKPEAPKGIIEITKVDKDTNELLDGAVFELTVGTNTYPGETGEAGEKGKLVFRNLPIGETYTLVEKRHQQYILNRTTQSGLIVDSNVIEIKIGNEKEDNPGSDPAPEELTGTLEVIKLDDETKEPLEGAQFSLSIDGVKFVKTTDIDGKAIFKDLPTGVDYTLIEEEAPRGYIKEAMPKSGNIATGSALIPVYNKKDTGSDKESDKEPDKEPDPIPTPEPDPTPVPEESKGIIEVIKRDKNTNNPLEGVEFILDIGQRQFIRTTDVNGKIRFEGLPIGEEYILTESKMLEGYILDRTTRSGLILDNEVIKLQIYNEREAIPLPEPEPMSRPTPIKVIVVKTPTKPNDEKQEEDNESLDSSSDNHEKTRVSDASESASILDDPTDDKVLEHEAIITLNSQDLQPKKAQSSDVDEEIIPKLGEDHKNVGLIILLGWLFILMGILLVYRRKVIEKNLMNH
ncbi:SpaA isopeptide-forming pilin-related protein [Cellulosilyticum ruminicola]|uniref:SpaA isopeptide-forming pilin-related protein n=1 Tax=Cellulosilyticum ruminicola TaxID=425254 RepID=UPI0006D1AA47|nr:SpaA isopeptide-forming pilin-related protein [Cellulosilyticum ruminicola]